MWLETIAALLFILGLWPFWLIGALAWGTLKGCIIFAALLFAAIADAAFSVETIWTVPTAALLEAASAAWSIPSWAWSWAKYEHPWIAMALGLIGVGMQGGSNSR